MSRLSIPFALLTLLRRAPAARVIARAEAGTPVQNVELRTLAGGREKLLSPKVKANVFVFFRPATSARSTR